MSSRSAVGSLGAQLRAPDRPGTDHPADARSELSCREDGAGFQGYVAGHAPVSRWGAATGFDSGEPRWRRKIESDDQDGDGEELALPVLERLEPELRRRRGSPAMRDGAARRGRAAPRCTRARRRRRAARTRRANSARNARRERVLVEAERACRRGAPATGASGSLRVARVLVRGARLVRAFDSDEPFWNRKTVSTT